MEVDQQQHHFVEMQEEQEQVSLQHRRRHNSNSMVAVSCSNGGVVDSESEITKNGFEEEHSNGIVDFQSPDTTAFQFQFQEQTTSAFPNNILYFDHNLVTKSVDEDFEMKNGSIPSLTFETNPADADVNNTNDLEKDESLLFEVNECRNNLSNGLSDSILTALNHVLDEQTTESKPLSNGTTVVEDLNSIEEVDQGDTEFDVEKVLEKQNTHDLYCPNCKSCITRRVILRRKGLIRNARRKTKHNKVEAKSPSLNAVSTNGFNVQVHETGEIHSSDSPALATNNHHSGREPKVYIHSSSTALAADNHSHSSDTSALEVVNHNSGREPEVFRCLSCFSIFIPTGNGFKLFWPFGENGNNENVQDLQTTPARNSNWLSSVFRADKKKLPVEQGNETEPNQHGLLASTAPPSLGLVSDVGSVFEQAREEIAISSTEESKYFENVSTGMREKLDTATVKAETDGAASSYFISTVQKENEEADPAEPLPGIPVTGAIVEEASTRSPQGRGTPILKGEVTGNKEAAFVSTDSKNAGNDVIVIIQTSSLDPAVSQPQISQGSDGSIEVSRVLQTRTPAYTSQDVGVTLDILKSIVFGGLIECIASLGVVSSAAGAGSSTLNILALGLANVIGGLFIIAHNLFDLRKDMSSTSSNEQENRYEATLGRRGKFPLHATVAIISFVVFGMLAPVVYGFSFRASDDKDLKLAVVGGASLICIMLLAMAKAYIRRADKAYISTVLSYVIIGIMASGVSYVVGDLISKLMEKLGWFVESSLAVPIITVPATASRPFQLQWSSY
ncbi:Vacuolar iron transporter (VIT) family protein [Euphorbia peplus]|nr:Vacuolar iron transporter (VIT) family protein [Euphorbia peplus]